MNCDWMSGIKALQHLIMYFKGTCETRPPVEGHSKQAGHSMLTEETANCCSLYSLP